MKSSRKEKSRKFNKNSNKKMKVYKKWREKRKLR